MAKMLRATPSGGKHWICRCRQCQELEGVFDGGPSLSDDGAPHPERFYP